MGSMSVGGLEILIVLRHVRDGLLVVRHTLSCSSHDRPMPGARCKCQEGMEVRTTALSPLVSIFWSPRGNREAAEAESGVPRKRWRGPWGLGQGDLWAFVKLTSLASTISPNVPDADDGNHTRKRSLGHAYLLSPRYFTGELLGGSRQTGNDYRHLIIRAMAIFSFLIDQQVHRVHWS